MSQHSHPDESLDTVAARNAAWLVELTSERSHDIERPGHSPREATGSRSCASGIALKLEPEGG
jgi:hypothetical protein